jgi:molybdopterin-binding protein
MVFLYINPYGIKDGLNLPARLFFNFSVKCGADPAFYRKIKNHHLRYNQSNPKEDIMRISARNMIKGRIKKLVHGAVNSEVVIEIPGGAEIVSIITKESAESLGLKEGKEVYAVIKASSVMVAVD